MPIMHPQHFGTDLTDICIRINPKIRIQITDHFWLKLWHWRRFTLSESSCILFMYNYFLHNIQKFINLTTSQISAEVVTVVYSRAFTFVLRNLEQTFASVDFYRAMHIRYMP